KSARLASATPHSPAPQFPGLTPPTPVYNSPQSRPTTYAPPDPAPAPHASCSSNTDPPSAGRCAKERRDMSPKNPCPKKNLINWSQIPHPAVNNPPRESP